MRLRADKALLTFAALVALSGCSSRVNRFEVVSHNPKTHDGYEITRSEVADQGGGAPTSDHHVMDRNTVGGSYARRVNVTGAGSGYVVSGGLHGNPRARH